MAVTFTAAGTAAAASGASPQNITTTTSFAVGDYLVIAMAFDNSGGGGASPVSSAMTPTGGSIGTWVAQQLSINDPGAASAGLACHAYVYGTVTAPISSGTVIALNWSGTVVVRAAALAKVSTNTAGATLAYRTNSGATGTNVVASAAPALTTPSVTSGELVVCYAGHENGANIVGDADTTNGSWSAITTTFNGSAQTGMAVGIQGKVVTATATQAFNPTGTLSDWILGAFIFTEVPPPPSITQAAYQFFDDAGTESGAAALGALNTAINPLLVGADGFGVLRVRLQSTTAIAVPATDDWQLQYEMNASGSWINEGTGAVIAYNNPNLTAGAATTNRLGAGTGSFVAGKISETGDVTDLGWTANNYTELVYSLQLVAAQLAGGDVLRFRVLRNGVTTNMTYSVTPTINIKVPVAVAGGSSGTSGATGTLQTAAAAAVGTRALEDSTQRSTEAGTPRALESAPGVVALEGGISSYSTASGTLTVGQTVWLESSGAASAPSFDPEVVPNLYLWYDASDSASITLNGSSNVVGLGSQGHGPALTNSSTPITVGSRNGLSTLVVPSSTLLAGTLPAAFTGLHLTMFAVCQINDLNSYSRLASMAFNASTDDYGGGGIGFGKEPGSFPSLIRTLSDRVLSPTLEANWAVTTYEVNGVTGVCSVKVNGTTVATNTIMTGAFNASRFALFASAGNYNDWWAGTFGELIMYDRVLTTTEQDDLVEYLTGKWIASPVYSDNFNRADGALAAPWVTIEGSHSIVGNRVPVGPASPNVSYYDQTFAADQWAEADMAGAVADGSHAVPAVRITPGGNFYYFWRIGSAAAIWKRVGGSYSQVGPTGTTTGSAFKARLEVEGTTLRAYVDGVLAVITTDSSITTGKPGFLSANGTSATLDNFLAGDLPYTPQPDLHYDASDSASLTTAGALVTAMASQGAHGPALSTANSMFAIGASLNGRACLVTNQPENSAYYALTGALSETFTPITFSAVMAFWHDDITTYARAFSLATSGSDWNNLNNILLYGKEPGSFPSVTRNGGNVYSDASYSGRWIVSVITINAGAVTIYVDGVQKGTGSTANSPLNSTRMGIFGQGDPNERGDTMRGKFGEFKLWKNRVLSPAEVIAETAALTAKWIDPVTGGGGLGGAGSSTASGALSVAKAPIQLQASASGISTAAGTLAVARRLAVTAPAGTSTTTAALRVARALVATAPAGTSSTTGTLTKAVPVAGTAGGTSTATASTLDITRAVVGFDASAGGSSTATGSLGIAIPLAGTSTATSSAAASTMPVARALAGTSTATSTATATGMVRSVTLAAPAAGGSSTTTGSLTRVVGLAGSAPGGSSATGALIAARALAAPASTGSSSATGSLAVSRPLVAASAVGGSTTTGALLVAKTLVASASGISTATGDLIVARTLVGTSTGGSSTTANMVASDASGMSALVIGTSTATGSLRVARALVGSSSGLSASTGTIAKTVQLTATTGGSSTTSAAAAVARPLAGSSAGGSTATGSFVGSVSMAASSSGLSAATGALARAVPLLGTPVAGLSTATSPRLVIARALEGSSVGLSTTAGDTRVARALVARADGLSTADANIALARRLVGASNGIAQAVGALTVVSYTVITGWWNGQETVTMMYGDKPVVDWLMIPS